MYNELYTREFYNFSIVDNIPDDMLLIQVLVLSLISGFLSYFLTSLIFSQSEKYVITIVRGLPGSGKTSWVDKQINKMPNSVSINMDEYVNDGDTLRRAHIRVYDVLHYLLESEKWNYIFVEGIFSSKWEYELIEELANTYDFNIRLIEIVGPKNKNQMFLRSNYLKNSGMWDMRWCKFLMENWETDNRAHFIDLEVEYESETDVETSSETEDATYSYFNVEDVKPKRYNLRPRHREVDLSEF